jgi:hypothetical protein
MTHTLTAPGALPQTRGWFARAEAWLDRQGKGAWIAALVLSFILFWPLGLALLAYLIWGKALFTPSCQAHRKAACTAGVSRSSGNSAFDAYKADTLRRLEDEQQAFEAFLDRLRAAKDQAEFDQFLKDRATGPKPDMDQDAG